MTDPPGGPPAEGAPIPQVERPIGPAEALKVLQTASGVVLTTHVNADGDAAGSQAALAAYLSWRFRAVQIVNPTPFPERYRFLLPDPAPVIPATDEAAARYCASCTLAVIVDAGQVPRIGRVNKLVRHLPKLVIDHHPPGPRPFQGMVFRDESAPATGSMILEILEQAGIKGQSREVWSPVAPALYTALLADTGGFRFASVTPRCFQDAARLVELGAKPEALHQAIFGRFPRRRYDLLREALATLEVHADGRVAWMTVPKKEYDRLGAAVDDLEGFVDVPRNLDGVEVAMLFRTTADGKTKVSLRSTGDVNVNEIATEFGGGGHARAAGVVLPGDREAAMAQVVARVEEALAAADEAKAAEAAATAEAEKTDEGSATSGSASTLDAMYVAEDYGVNEEDALGASGVFDKLEDRDDEDDLDDLDLDDLDDLDDQKPASAPGRSNVLPWPIRPSASEEPSADEKPSADERPSANKKPSAEEEE